MKKVVIGIIVIALIALFAGRAWYLNQQEEDKNVVRIGAILPLTGIAASSGEMAKNAILMAQEEFNKGDHAFKIKAILEDGKHTIKDSINAYRKLEVAGVDIVITDGEPPSRAVLPIVKEKNLPVYTAVRLDLEYPLAPIFFPEPKKTYGTLANFTVQNLKSKRIAIITQNAIAMNMASDIFQERVEKQGMEIVSHERINLDALDVKDVVVKTISAKPDTIFITGFGPSYVALLNTLRTHKFQGKIMTDMFFNTYRDNLLEKGEGVYFVDTLFSIDSTDPMAREFLTKYQDKYNAQPDMVAALLYETFNIIANAIPEAEYTPQQVFDNVMKTKNVPSIFGPLSMGSDRYIDMKLVIKQMQADGSAKVVGE